MKRKKIAVTVMSVIMALSLFVGDAAVGTQNVYAAEEQSTEEKTAPEETEKAEQEVEETEKTEQEVEETENIETVDETESMTDSENEGATEKVTEAEKEKDDLQESVDDEQVKAAGKPQDSDEMNLLEDDPLIGRVEGYLSDEFYDSSVNDFSVFSMYDSGYTHNSRYNGMTVRDGIDVSYYQGDIDWNAVRNAGIEFAIIRVGYRGYQYGNLSEDPKFWQNIQGAKAAGLKVGVYIFSQAINETEAAEEANFVLSRIGGYDIDLPIVMDFEYVSGVSNRGRLYQAGLSKDGATSVCNAFCSTVINAGYTPMIYANKSMLENQVDGNYLGARYKIWLANYTRQTSYTGPYNFWQYSSSGYVNGISGRVDMNFWYDDSTMTPTVSTEDASRFVTLLYESFLEREPDQGGLDHWIEKLKNGNTGAEVAYGFVFSNEFTMQNYSDSIFLERLYQGLMGRASDESGKADWQNKLSNGVSREYVFKQFVDSVEFTNKCTAYDITRGTITLSQGRDQNYSLTRFVARNYTEFLGRNYDVDGLNYWCNWVLNGKGNMAELASGFVFSKECMNKNLSNSEFVKMLYRGCFDREADEKGYAEWVADLDSGKKSREDVFRGFANSQEFYDMVQSYGL